MCSSWTRNRFRATRHRRRCRHMSTPIQFNYDFFFINSILLGADKNYFHYIQMSTIYREYPASTVPSKRNRTTSTFCIFSESFTGLVAVASLALLNAFATLALYTFFRIRLWCVKARDSHVQHLNLSPVHSSHSEWWMLFATFKWIAICCFSGEVDVNWTNFICFRRWKTTLHA